MGQKGFWTGRSRTHQAPPTSTGQPVRTASLDRSIWRDLREETFRGNVVTLAKRCNEVGWKVDVLAGVSSAPAIVERSVLPSQTMADDASYQVPLEVERRLTTDIAFIAANEAGAPKVTAACVEENYAENEIRLWLAANAGIEGCVEEALFQIWDTAVASVTAMKLNTSNGEAHDGYQGGSRQRRLAEDIIFDRIVHLNRVRIRTRLRNVLGYNPEHIGAHVPSSRHAGGLQKVIKCARKHATGHHGQVFLAGLESILEKMTSINESYSMVANVDADESMVEEMKELTRLCYSLTMKREDGQMAWFRDILQATGLNADKMLNRKCMAEIEKIGSYRRISRTLLQDCLDLCREEGNPPRLRIERMAPYQPTTSRVSIRSKPVDCHVHAEIQLLCKWLKLSRANQRLPRVIGASKLSCFLCFLCVSCCGGPAPPRPHGRIYDQWTIPDSSDFDDQCIDTLRRTTALMNQRVVEMSKLVYSPRLWPMTSLVDFSGLDLASLASDESLSVTSEEPSIDQVLADAAEHETEPGLESLPSVTTVISLEAGKTQERSSEDSIRSSASISGSAGSSQATGKAPASDSDASIRSSASASGSNSSSGIASTGTTRAENMPPVEHGSDSTSEETQEVTGKAPSRSSDDSIRSRTPASGSGGSLQVITIGSSEEIMPTIEHDSEGTEKAPARHSNDRISSSASSSGSASSSQAKPIGTIREDVVPTITHGSDSTPEETQVMMGKAPVRISDDGPRSSASSSGSADSSQAAPIGTTREEIMHGIEHDSDGTFEQPQVVQLPKFIKTFYIDSKPRIKLLLEVEEPCNGEAQLSTVAPDDVDDTKKIDLSRLIRGEEITVVRKEGESDVCVDLCSGSGAEGHRLKLSWIS